MAFVQPLSPASGSAPGWNATYPYPTHAFPVGADARYGHACKSGGRGGRAAHANVSRLYRRLRSHYCGCGAIQGRTALGPKGTSKFDSWRCGSQPGSRLPREPWQKAEEDKTQNKKSVPPLNAAGSRGRVPLYLLGRNQQVIDSTSLSSDYFVGF